MVVSKPSNLIVRNRTALHAQHNATYRRENTARLLSSLTPPRQQPSARQIQQTTSAARRLPHVMYLQDGRGLGNVDALQIRRGEGQLQVHAVVRIVLCEHNDEELTQFDVAGNTRIR
jgi:hypothetical protein